ncbi:MAG: filamentous hemagglutinin N-terminal domain-containing protein, partial [Candidatus Omnitrophica bacterium]|nr:filamentous hemagglutinin N-terminal domain-containing protein [Candidatus Omnitrophota bacterium]
MNRRKKIDSVKLILIVFLVFFLGSTNVWALPEGGNVENGSATFDQPNPATLNITASDKAVINFQSFNIAQNEAVNFIQPSVSSSVLNRVIGPNASDIAGRLTANGMLFLVNPNGINFAPTAQVQANAFVASTLDIATNNFIAGNYAFEKNLLSSYASIINQGFITGKNISLIASAVRNEGTIIARLGRVHLASGDKVTVSFDAKGLIQVEVTEQTSGKVYDANGKEIKDAVANAGTIEGGQVMMTVQAASDMFENAVNQTGIVKATGFAEENGVIRVRANKNIKISGTAKIENKPAKGTISIQSFDSVTVTAELDTTGNTTLSAFKDIIVNADVTTTSGDLELLADADLDGTGAFKQAKDTTIKTVNPANDVNDSGKRVGDITIQSSGASTIANIESAGDLILQQG